MVFWVAAVLSAAFVAWGTLGTESLAAVFDAVLWSFLVPSFGWVFTLSSFGFLAFAVYPAFSRYGKVRLGAQDERPEFSTVSWVAMMFSAGMGTGLMFFGVAEPLSHMGAPRSGRRSPTPGAPPRWPCSTPTSTGRSTRGRSTPSWA
ncbi:MAG TPA: BCCT family transporter [Rubrobacter sp.]|nr:BCCT family transporter [Rubrobacter sp.]